jgi:hypothetical protein
MCCQWVRRGRKVTPDNPDARSPITAFKSATEKVATASSFGCVEILLVINHCYSTACVYSFEVPLADGKKVVGTPTPATNSMPRQRLRCVPGTFNSSEVKVFHPT